MTQACTIRHGLCTVTVSRKCHSLSANSAQVERETLRAACDVPDLDFQCLAQFYDCYGSCSSAYAATRDFCGVGQLIPDLGNTVGRSPNWHLSCLEHPSLSCINTQHITYVSLVLLTDQMKQKHIMQRHQNADADYLMNRANLLRSVASASGTALVFATLQPARQA